MKREDEITDDNELLRGALVVYRHRLTAEFLVDALKLRYPRGTWLSANSHHEATTLAQIMKLDFAMIEWLPDQQSSEALVAKLRTFSNQAVRILAVSPLRDATPARAALRAGATGFLCCSDANVSELRAAAEATIGGQRYVSPSVIGQSISDDCAHTLQPTSRLDLTKREREILAIVGVGTTNKSVAQSLGISPRTVESHKENLKNKLGVSSNSELATAASVWLKTGSILK